MEIPIRLSAIKICHYRTRKRSGVLCANVWERSLFYVTIFFGIWHFQNIECLKDDPMINPFRFVKSRYRFYQEENENSYNENILPIIPEMISVWAFQTKWKINLYNIFYVTALRSLFWLRYLSTYHFQNIKYLKDVPSSGICLR